MPRHHYRAVRVSHCQTPDCPNPAGEQGWCAEHQAERVERHGRFFAEMYRPRGYVADPGACRVCGEPTHDDRTTCELDRHPIPDITEEP